VSWQKLLAATLSFAMALPLGGCGYDYLQHTDRIAYSTGDAVKANLEAETINPSKRSMYVTSGLGKNGVAAGPSGSAPPPPAPRSP
jgi:hypothetical protein